ncbi:SDR family oxidoreductase [Granulosicoccus antarcticus]|uniref:Sorbitol dehydrogenase n=1 Tax=Granulosicoccus antarcticus IMCC3135 TaxID=1192854 RepID=A0A2Z2NMD1_9GAMM|nr:SDR family oxidoreductase [Granulosicoccus antarcticus]ASJ72353.1 Sorbitol dehydrogenase [Granulosicoccus antarcticus IMCC3135]
MTRDVADQVCIEAAVEARHSRIDILQLGEKKRQAGASVPIGRMATASDLVGMAVFLASRDADYIVAQTYNVDGGNWMS